MRQDNLFKDPRGYNGKFRFDAKTAEVFDDMVKRSVPFYLELQRMIIELVRAFVQEGTNVYDLGCSTGTTIERMVSAVREEGVRFVGVDYSRPMLARAYAKLRKKKALSRSSLIHADLSKPFKITNASVVIANLTVQFIPLKSRLRLIRNIYRSLRPGGCLILVEKAASENHAIDKRFTEFYYAYKKRHGYSEREIVNKDKALKGVLLPGTYAQNLDMIKKGGFTTSEEFFRWYLFSGTLAIKE